MNQQLGALSLNRVQRLHQVERQLGETEVSYFLPSRESGVNDMYVLLLWTRFSSQ